MPTLNSVPSYRKFTNDRDKALEAMLRRTQKRVSDLSKGAFDNILVAVQLKYRQINEHNRFTHKGRLVLDSLYGDVDYQLRMLADLIGTEVDKLQRATKTLSYAGELEAIGRVFDRRFHMRTPAYRGKDFTHSAYLSLSNMGAKIRKEIESGYVQEKDLDKVLERVKEQFPKVVRYKQPPRNLRPVKEAGLDNDAQDWADDATVDFIDDAEWRNVVQLYKDEYIPKNRNLTYDVEVGEPELEEWYGWEIENHIADDFLSQVKDGMVDAANEADISDFLWVSILDDRTRDEHRLKNGLTSTEIQAKLDGEWADFEDDSIVAPGGYNCRCRSTPYVANLPEVAPVNYKDFDTWLNS